MRSAAVTVFAASARWPAARRAWIGIDVGRAQFSVSNAQEPLRRCGGDDPYDVVIVGGGMVGAAVGCGLASSPLARSLRVAIVDGSPVKTGVSSKDSVPNARVSAITPTTVRFLQDVKAWNTVLENRHSPFDSMQVWDYSGGGFTRYEAADVGEEVLGYVVENNVLISSLSSALQCSGFAEIIQPAQVKEVHFAAAPSHQAESLRESHAVVSQASEESKDEVGSSSRARDENLAEVLIEGGRVLHTRLVVGADGGNSRVRTMARLRTTGWEYNQQALICTVEVGYQHSTAWQRFLPTGPLALLPVGGKYSNIVWSTTQEKAKELKEMSAEKFVMAVNNALTEDYGPAPTFGLGAVVTSKWLSPLFDTLLPPSATKPFLFPPPVTECLTPRLSFPLSLRHANKYVSTRLALVGDAAHTVHPLAGQGVNLGFGDAASLVKIINEGIKTGADIGELALLERYERDRLWANVPMIGALDSFQRVFSADFLPVNLARAVGFNVANYVRPLKKTIISYAMGR